MGRAPAPLQAPERGHRGGIEVADIVRAHGAAYRPTHGLSRAQRRALHAIEVCRTAALGGHRDVCDRCGAERISDNSCRNRHGPKCPTLAKARWLEARRAELLPVEYFHVVFTLPHALYGLLPDNARLLYDLLFRTTAATLTTFARDPRHLGGDVGVTAVLHTWGQTLSQHIHLHCLVTGVALARDGTRWIPAKPGLLFPVRALAQVFRAKYLDALHAAQAAGRLRLPDPLAEPGALVALLPQLRHHDWVVCAKRPFAGPAQVLDYLGHYTHRVAISNERLLSLADGRVRFRWRDYADGDRVKIMDLAAEEFLRRFLLHIVPERFVRIRHFGFLANRARQTKLPRCRQLLACSAVTPATGVRPRPDGCASPVWTSRAAPCAAMGGSAGSSAFRRRWPAARARRRPWIRPDAPGGSRGRRPPLRPHGRRPPLPPARGASSPGPAGARAPPAIRPVTDPASARPTSGPPATPHSVHSLAPPDRLESP